MKKDLLFYLEQESISIIRDSFAKAKNPVMLYSIGKDSSVMLHLARKAFYPLNIPFPLLHIDTKWKFKEMILFREKIEKKYKLDIIVYTSSLGIQKKLNPFDHGSYYTEIMKTCLVCGIMEVLKAMEIKAVMVVKGKKRNHL